MPPKFKSNSDELRLLLKRGKQVLVLLVGPKTTLNDIKSEIKEMINVTGGLKPLDDDDDDDLNVDRDESEDDIDIPAPSFDQDDSDNDIQTYDNANNGSKKKSQAENEDDDDARGSTGDLIDSTQDIKIGKPVDKSQPSGTNFSEVGNGGSDSITVRELQVVDGNILAFARTNEDFLVVDPVDTATE